mgnify:CR=1 FL=1
MAAKALEALALQAREVGGLFVQELEEVDRDLAFADLARLPRADIDTIHPDPHQPRKKHGFERESIERLADIIQREGGLWQPIHVRPRRSGRAGEWEIVHGERRWRALRLLVHERGLERFRMAPILVEEADRPRTALDRRIKQVAEDLHKVHHAPIDNVAAIQEIVTEMVGQGSQANITAPQLAARLSIDEKLAQRYLRVCRTLRKDEIDLIRTFYPDVGLDPLLGLIQWINRQEQVGEGWSDMQRLEAIRTFATNRLTRTAIASALAPYAARRRPARRVPPARFQIRPVDRRNGIVANIRIPAQRLNDPETLIRAEALLRDLLAGIERLRSELHQA